MYETKATGEYGLKSDLTLLGCVRLRKRASPWSLGWGPVHPPQSQGATAADAGVFHPL